jgi:hypothetical protein
VGDDVPLLLHFNSLNDYGDNDPAEPLETVEHRFDSVVELSVAQKLVGANWVCANPPTDMDV